MREELLDPAALPGKRPDAAGCPGLNSAGRYRAPDPSAAPPAAGAPVISGANGGAHRPPVGGPQANRAALDYLVYLDLWRMGVYALAFATEQGRPALPRDAGAARTPIIR